MYALFAVMFVTLLTACVTKPTLEPVIVVKEVQIPVPVRCMYPDIEKPILHFENPSPDMDEFDVMKALYLDRTSLKKENEELRGALLGCSTNPSGG